VLARALEQGGLATAAIVLIKEHAQRVKPPRALFVSFPFGYALGRPDDPPFQHRVLAAALGLVSQSETPLLAEFAENSDAPTRLLHASVAQQAGANLDGDAADEVTALRRYYERWVEEHGGRTQVGLCGVPERRFRGLIRFLQSYAEDDTADYSGRPTDMPVPRFVRLAADDLKAFYFEARMAQRPDQIHNDLQRWFWAETAMGALLKRIADRMNGSNDAFLKRTAFGIAR
jgi:hypothetical protein